MHSYSNDPMCGFYFTAEGMRDFFKILGEANARRWAYKMPAAIPVLLFSGDQDPMGGYGHWVNKIYRRLQRAGHTVTFLLYPGGRHHMLMETNKEEVFREIYVFLWKYFNYTQSALEEA